VTAALLRRSDPAGCTDRSLSSTDSRSAHAIVHDLLDRVREAVRYHSKSAVRAQDLKQAEARLRPGRATLKLLSDVKTRWSSTFTMLERALVLLPSLNASIPRPLTGHDAALMKDVRIDHSCFVAPSAVAHSSIVCHRRSLRSFARSVISRHGFRV
jgi:hypothetical protein